MVDWENDREYRTDSTTLSAQWTWPATVAFISLLAFVGFIVWVFFG